MKSCLWLMSLLLTASSFALESTIILDIDHSWNHESTEFRSLALTLDLSASLSDNLAFTTIIRSQILGPDVFEPGNSEQVAVSPVSQRYYFNPSTELELRELYLDIDLPFSALRLGKQQVVWGQADGLKLLDVVNPQDFRHFILDDFDDSRIPLWMFNWELFLAWGDLQILWVPDTSMHDLPERNALFEIIAPFANLPEGLPLHFQNLDRPDHVLKDSDLGLRFSMFLGGWDITLNYLYHYDDFPVVKKRLDKFGLGLSAGYERTHTFGASISNAFGDFILRSEFVLNTDKYLDSKLLSSIDGIEKRKEFAYVVGIDWTGLPDTFVSAQIFQSILLDEGDSFRPDTDTTITILLRQNFMNESLVFDLLWIYHQNENDHLMRIGADYELSSNISVRLYMDIFSGEDSELFGQFDERDQVGVGMTIGF